jgi:protein-disulfide isomerase
MNARRFAAFVLALLCAAPASAAISREELKTALKANPDVLLEVLKDKKAELLMIVSDAAREQQEKKQQEEAQREEKERDNAFKNPFKPVFDDKTRFRGDKNAPITIVEYSDFQCPYCTRGFQTVEALRKKYGAKIRVVFRNFPLPFHPQAMPAAAWYEAVALQSADKAWVFHDKLFENQDKLGEAYYKQLVKELGLDAKKAEADAKSEAVKARIEAEIKEGKGFGMEGTPGYLINGVPLRGAYPIEAFDEIIQRHLKG